MYVLVSSLAYARSIRHAFLYFPHMRIITFIVLAILVAMMVKRVWATVIIIALAILFLVNVQQCNYAIGAADNVGCYHEMRAIKKQYHKLPRHQSYSGSLSHDVKGSTVFTKPEAIKRYRQLKRAYRNPKVNATKSTHVPAPQLWQFL